MVQIFFNQQYTCKSACGDEGYVILVCCFLGFVFECNIRCVPLGPDDSVTSYFRGYTYTCIDSEGI